MHDEIADLVNHTLEQEISHKRMNLVKLVHTLLYLNDRFEPIKQKNNNYMVTFKNGDFTLNLYVPKHIATKEQFAQLVNRVLEYPLPLPDNLSDKVSLSNKVGSGV